jgi:hypothetical protein
MTGTIAAFRRADSLARRERSGHRRASMMSVRDRRPTFGRSGVMAVAFVVAVFVAAIGWPF